MAYKLEQMTDEEVLAWIANADCHVEKNTQWTTITDGRTTIKGYKDEGVWWHGPCMQYTSKRLAKLIQLSFL